MKAKCKLQLQGEMRNNAGNGISGPLHFQNFLVLSLSLSSCLRLHYSVPCLLKALFKDSFY